MWKITASSTNYNRKIGTVQFRSGIAETDDKWMAEWFSGKGFEVVAKAETDAEREIEKPTRRKAKE